jgi:hypothetical protein
MVVMVEFLEFRRVRTPARHGQCMAAPIVRHENPVNDQGLSRDVEL